MNKDSGRLRTHGGEVALVTMGTAQQTAEFRNRFELPFICFADPEQIAYVAYEIPRGRIGQVAGPAVWGAGLKSFFRVGAGKPIGDVWQMPAAFVIDSRGIIRYSHYANSSPEHPTHEDILDMLAHVRQERVKP